MSSILPEGAIAQDAIQAHDWDIACDHSQHEGETPAAWAVWMKAVGSCGCPPLAPFHYWCHICWSKRLPFIVCNSCGAVEPGMSSIAHAEVIA